jgi:hypothetical protein
LRREIKRRNRKNREIDQPELNRFMRKKSEKVLWRKREKLHNKRKNLKTKKDNRVKRRYCGEKEGKNSTTENSG